jgi:hypothetical protein
MLPHLACIFTRKAAKPFGEIVWWHRQANDRGGRKSKVKKLL